jgi:adenosine deaminase
MGNLTIQKEYLNAKEQMGLSRSELELVQINGLESAFLSVEEKRNIYPGK